MTTTFAGVVEEVKRLSVAEKQELRSLLDQYLIEERRHEIYENYLASSQELSRGELSFSSDSTQLKEWLRDG